MCVSVSDCVCPCVRVCVLWMGIIGHTGQQPCVSLELKWQIVSQLTLVLGTNLRSLKEQSSLLTPEPFLHPFSLSRFNHKKCFEINTTVWS